MSATTETIVFDPAGSAPVEDEAQRARQPLYRKLLSRRYSGIWMLAGLITLFSVLETQTRP